LKITTKIKFLPYSIVSSYFSRNSTTYLELFPIELANHSEHIPDGSIKNNLGFLEVSNPQINIEAPIGLTPPF